MDIRKKMSARVWTKQECKQTLKECKNAGLQIKSTDGMIEVFNQKDLVVSWVNGANNNLVRVDLNYFKS